MSMSFSHPLRRFKCTHSLFSFLWRKSLARPSDRAPVHPYKQTTADNKAADKTCLLSLLVEYIWAELLIHTSVCVHTKYEKYYKTYVYEYIKRKKDQCDFSPCLKNDCRLYLFMHYEKLWYCDKSIKLVKFRGSEKDAALINSKNIPNLRGDDEEMYIIIIIMENIDLDI